MIPVPASGMFEGVDGESAARAVLGVTDLEITARLHDYIAAWPEGSSYLGFLFARAESPEEVERVLATHPAVRAASRAMGAVFGKEPVIIREGGSIPPVEVFQRVLGIQSVLVGVGLPDDQIHAPNEKFDLDQYAMGVRVLARLWDEIGKEMA